MTSEPRDLLAELRASLDRRARYNADRPRRVADPLDPENWGVDPDALHDQRTEDM